METVGTLSFSIELEEKVSPGQILRGEVKCFSTQIEDLRGMFLTIVGQNPSQPYNAKESGSQSMGRDPDMVREAFKNGS